MCKNKNNSFSPLKKTSTRKPKDKKNLCRFIVFFYFFSCIPKKKIEKRKKKKIWNEMKWPKMKDESKSEKGTKNERREKKQAFCDIKMSARDTHIQ